MPVFYGINQCKDHAYGAAAALSYWVFRCRDKSKSPAMGTKTWNYLESSIQNAAEISTCIEDFLQILSNKLIASLRPAELNWVVQPAQRIYRINSDGAEIQELQSDQELVFMGWRDLLVNIEPHGFSEWDVLELCRTRANIIQVLVRLRFEEDRALGKSEPEEVIEVGATNV
jgi:hypothetical protein